MKPDVFDILSFLWWLAVDVAMPLLAIYGLYHVVMDVWRWMA